MRRSVAWMVRGGLLALLLGIGWLYRVDLLTWFVPGAAVEYAETQEPVDDGIAYWTCAMHPSVHAEESGPCPVCGMDLQPVPESTPTAAPTAQSGGPATQPTTQPSTQPTTQPTTQPAAGVPGFITLTPYQRQLIGVTTASVERRSVSSTIRTVGRVDYDETKLTDVSLKVKGWIESLYVDYTGMPVLQGQPLFSLYSPDLVSTQQEYLLSLRSLRQLETDGQAPGNRDDDAVGDEALARQRTLVDAARQRLLWWDLSDAQVRQLEQDSTPSKSLTIQSPASGIVVDKMAVAGMYAAPGMRLYRIASLDTVWVLADVYENDVRSVHRDQAARITLPYLPGETLTGSVDYVYPYLDAKTRTVRIRLRVANPRLQLRPDMYADVELDRVGEPGLLVPESAVLFSGKRRVAFVDLGDGRFEPRLLRLGGRTNDHYEVIEGLAEGERVVTAATFLLDSESKLKNVMAAMAPLDE